MPGKGKRQSPRSEIGAQVESYHCDIPLGMVPKPPVKKNLNEYPHEVNFKPGNPSKKGYNGLMGWPQGRGEPPKPFPDWIPDPAPAAKRYIFSNSKIERIFLTSNFLSNSFKCLNFSKSIF